MITAFSISLFLFILYMHCPLAWEGIFRPKAWEDESKILAAERAIYKIDQEEPTPAQPGQPKVAEKGPGYRTLDEDETDDESIENFPGNSSPPSNTKKFHPADQEVQNQYQNIQNQDTTDGFTTAEVYAVAE